MLRQSEVKDHVPQSGLADESRVEDVSPQQEEQDTLKCPICSRENCDEDHESTFLFHKDQYKDHNNEEHIKLTGTADLEVGLSPACLTIFEEINQFKRLKTVTIIGFKLKNSSLSNLFRCFTIRSLTLSNCQLCSVPPTLANLKDLEILDLSHNRFTTLPEMPIRLLPCLKSLNVSNNNITTVDGYVVKTLQALQNLDVSHNNIKEIPYEILEMPSLQAFLCSNNKIARWLDPPNEEQEENAAGTLTFLDLSDNVLPEVPRYIKELKNLSVVNLSHNKIGAKVRFGILKQQISDLFYLPSVSTVQLGNNKIKILPSLDTAKVSPNIEFVDLSNNKINKVPTTMLLMATLKALLLGGNKITKLPSDLDLNSLSPKLRVIDLSDNSLKDVPLPLCFLRSLERLDLKQNNISTISENVRSCKSLSVLDVSHNRLKEIPSHVTGLPSLVEIHASNNEISSVSPLQSDESSVLKVIALAENGLSHFPEALMQMKSLKRVDLSNNEIKVIPQSIMGMPKDVKLNLQGNPIVDPPLQVCQAGLHAVQAFYEDLTTASSITQCLKTLFLGTYEAGKTSLVRVFQLNQSNLTKPEERTHGIEIAELPLSAPNIPDITLSVWDFAGQETYYITHQFFLSAKALMLLIVNLEKYDSDNFPSTCGKWLENMIAKVGNPVVIPVVTHIDKLSEEEVKSRCDDLAKKLADQERMRIKDLRRQLKRINESMVQDVRYRKKQIQSLLQKRPTIHANPVPVSSAESLKGIQYLKQVILNHAVNKEYFPEVGRPVPKAWADTEACVERKGGELSLPYMTWDEFTDLLRENVPNLQPESRIKTVAQYLHDTGKILWYSEIDSLRNHVFLKPAWLVDIFRKVIRHDLDTCLDYSSDPCYREAGISQGEFQKMKNDMVRNGILHTKLLRCLWSNVKKECRSGTFDTIFQVLIELMRQFDLCYDMENQRDDDLDQQQGAFATMQSMKMPWLMHKPWHYTELGAGSETHRLLLPWHIQEGLGDMAEREWESGRKPIISLQYQFPSFFPPGLFERLTVRAHGPEHNLHFVSHWKTVTLCKYKKKRALVLMKYEEGKGHVVSLSARPEGRDEREPPRVTLRYLWEILNEISLEVEDLLKQWPGVQFDRLTVCPKCREPSFPGNWLHSRSRFVEEEEDICPLCHERVSVEYLMPPIVPLLQPPPYVTHGRSAEGHTILLCPPRVADDNVTDRQLSQLSKKLGSEWESLAIDMGFIPANLYKFKRDNPYNTEQQIFAMLVAWRNRTKSATRRRLQAILESAGVDRDVISCLNETEIKIE